MTLSTPNLSLWIFALLFTPKPFSDFLTTIVPNHFPSVFYITQSDNRVSFLDFAHSRKVEGPGVLDLFEVWAIIVCANFFCKKTLDADQSKTDGLSAATKPGLCLSRTKSITLVKVNGTKLPEPGCRFLSKITMIRTIWTPLLDNISNLLTQLDSLLTVSALSLSFLVFFCPLEPHFRFFWVDTFKMVSKRNLYPQNW